MSGEKFSGSCIRIRAWVVSLMSLPSGFLSVRVMRTRLGSQPLWPSVCVVSHVSCHSRFFQFQNSSLTLGDVVDEHVVVARLLFGRLVRRPALLAPHQSIDARRARDRRATRYEITVCSDSLASAHSTRWPSVEKRISGTLPLHFAINIVRGCDGVDVLVLRQVRGLEVARRSRPSAMRSSWLRSS